MEKAGVAAVHIEDQVAAKRCGHRPGKVLVETEEMCDRIKSACDGRYNDDFVIMARTDSYAKEGLQGAVDRSLAYIDTGADMIFAEAINDTSAFKTFCEQIPVPVLANMTEFGKTDYITDQEFANAGIDMVSLGYSIAPSIFIICVLKIVRLFSPWPQAGPMALCAF